MPGTTALSAHQATASLPSPSAPPHLLAEVEVVVRSREAPVAAGGPTSRSSPARLLHHVPHGAQALVGPPGARQGLSLVAVRQVLQLRGWAEALEYDNVHQRGGLHGAQGGEREAGWPGGVCSMTGCPTVIRQVRNQVLNARMHVR